MFAGRNKHPYVPMRETKERRRKFAGCLFRDWTSFGMRTREVAQRQRGAFFNDYTESPHSQGRVMSQFASSSGEVHQHYGHAVIGL